MELCPVEWLPSPEEVMIRSRAAAMADLLLCPDVDLRQYHCTTNRADGVTLCSRHDGAGTYCFILQSGDSIAIKSCNMRKSVSPDALCRFQRDPKLPLSPLALRIIREPEFRYQELSFLAWSEAGQPWQGLKFSVEGKSSLDMGRETLDVIAQGARAYYVFAQTYHEVTIDPPALKSLFNLAPLDASLAKAISPAVNFASVQKDAAEIGYPLA